MTVIIIAVSFGVLIGALLGLVGGGGSILTVPILYGTINILLIIFPVAVPLIVKRKVLSLILKK